MKNQEALNKEELNTKLYDLIDSGKATRENTQALLQQGATIDYYKKSILFYRLMQMEDYLCFEHDPINERLANEARDKLQAFTTLDLDSTTRTSLTGQNIEDSSDF